MFVYTVQEETHTLAGWAEKWGITRQGASLKLCKARAQRTETIRTGAVLFPGAVVGFMIVLGRGNGVGYWCCRCRCGVEVEMWKGSILNGYSCGCELRRLCAARTKHWYDYNDERLSIPMAAKKYGIKPITLRKRLLVYGYTIERALTEPVGRRGRRLKGLALHPRE